MNNIIPIPEEEVMLKLVRLAVFGGGSFNLKDSDINWDKLMNISLEQGVLCWVWEGICKLPAEQQPPRQNRINWGLSVQEWRDSYYLQKDVLNQIISVCNREGISVLVLKGIGLSEIYPIPESRVSGDIDIYLFGDYEKGNQLFSGGNYTFGVGDKHASFIYQGINVENHLTLINTNTRKQRLVESYLESKLIDSKMVEDGYYILSPLSNLVFLIMHALSHMESHISVTIKNMVDIAYLLYKNRSSIDVTECLDVMHRIKIAKSFELLLSISEKVSGLSFMDFHENIIHKEDVQKALGMIFERCTSIEVPLSLPFFTQIKLRRSYYNNMRWKYQYLPFSRISCIVREYRPPISNAIKQRLKPIIQLMNINRQ